MLKKISKYIPLFGTVLLLESIVVLRFLYITRSYDYDEVFTAVTANPDLPLTYIFKHFLIIDVHPPLHNLIMWLWNHVFPYGAEWIGRLPSVLFDCGALWIAWSYFPLHLFKSNDGKTARWIFILLLAFNHMFIEYAQTMRAYALILCLAVPFTFLYLQMLHGIKSKKQISYSDWILYGLLALLLCYTHYFGAIAFGVFSVILFISAWKNKQE